MFDLALLCSVPVALVLVFSFPIETRRALGFNAHDPTLMTAYASHFVHLSFSHLLSNLVGYLLIVPGAYVLSVSSGHRRQFYGVFVLLVGMFPFVLSALDVFVAKPRLAVGFSGVLLGFYGYLPLSLYQYVSTEADGTLPFKYVPVMFFVGIASIAVVLVHAVIVSVVVGVIAAFLAGIYAALSYERGSVDRISELSSRGIGQTSLMSGILFLLYPLVAFPVSPGLGKAVHLLSHLFGYSMSFISVYVSAMLVRCVDSVSSGVDLLKRAWTNVRPDFLS